jgi:putative ABC transport system substrate-binding protein
MNRRELIALLGAAAVVPIAARAQQGEQMARLAVLSNAPVEAQGNDGMSALKNALRRLGRIEGRNLQIDVRWGGNDADRDREYAAELLALGPSVILAVGTLGVLSVLKATRTVPIVFVRVTDPVGAGVVDSLSHPGGNATGFMNFEYTLSGKWLELLKQVEPRLTRALVIRDAANPAGVAQFGALQAAAPSLGLELRPVDSGDPAQLERAIAALSKVSNGGLVVTPSATVSGNRKLIIALAGEHRVPAVYPFRYMVTDGGLISYGPDPIDQYRQAAVYIDRILKGEKPGDLPVQAPTRYELAINLKTAKVLGLELPSSVLARADEVIE